jgi:hypothetical protein
MSPFNQVELSEQPGRRFMKMDKAVSDKWHKPVPLEITNDSVTFIETESHMIVVV